MNPGLPQGFVRLNTNHHLVLQTLHELGPLRHRDLVDELPIDSRRVSMALAQLARNGLIHQHPAARAYDTGDRTQAVWSLEPYTGTKPLRPKHAPASQRSARYRAAKRLRVRSVFEFRPVAAAGGARCRGRVSEPV